MQYRIGDRDPVTGLYDVIWPDGSSTRNGLKIFNAAHQSGDVVRATRRSDGMIILDSAKAYDIDRLGSGLANPDLVEPPVGYLRGQVFNNEPEEPVLPPVLSIDIWQGNASQSEFAAVWTIRVSCESPATRRIRFGLGRSGTATYPDDYVFDIDPDFATIEVGQTNNDFLVTAVPDLLNEAPETIILSLLPLDYARISRSSVALTILPSNFTYTIYGRFTTLLTDPSRVGVGAWFVLETQTMPNTLPNRAAYDATWTALVIGSVEFCVDGTDFDSPCIVVNPLNGGFQTVSKGASRFFASQGNYKIVLPSDGGAPIVTEYRREEFYA